MNEFYSYDTVSFWQYTNGFKDGEKNNYGKKMFGLVVGCFGITEVEGVEPEYRTISKNYPKEGDLYMRRESSLSSARILLIEKGINPFIKSYLNKNNL